MPGHTLQPNNMDYSDSSDSETSQTSSMDIEEDETQLTDQPINSAPDHESSMTELEPDEFPSHFDEREQRLFVSSTFNTLYPLPVDGEEQKRVNYLHEVLKAKIGYNYVGPVRDVLAPDTSRTKFVIDLGTGTGRWIEQMAEEFSHVLFRGLDAVPICTRYPPPNVQFEIENIESSLRWDNGTVDIVHARDLSMSVRNYPALLREIARVLRPGGLFISGEWSHSLERSQEFLELQHSTGTAIPNAPSITTFFQTVTSHFRARAAPDTPDIQTLPHQLIQWVQDTNFFHDIRPVVYEVELDPWLDVEGRVNGVDCARRFKRSHKIYGRSVSYLLKGSGMSDAAVTTLIDNYRTELEAARGLVHRYHILCAKRN